MTLRVQRVSACIVAILSVGWSPNTSADNRSPDFDNDNNDDLVVGTALETAGGVSQAGVVNILYGSSSGLDDEAGRITTLWRGVTGVEGDPVTNGGFGIALAWGDFDGDCFDDLAVGGASHEAHVFYGSPTGLSTPDDEILNHFSQRAQAAGDFNGDGFDDLVLNTDWDEVTVVYGSASGLDDMAGPGVQIWDRAALGVPEFAAGIGFSLATGDFNCDGVDDLAMGAPWEHADPMSVDEQGAVYVLYGVPVDGLTTTGLQVWNQASPQVEGTPEHGDAFGASLAVGNFNNDSAEGHACHDLAIGAPHKRVGPTGTSHGAVNVLYGTAADGLQAISPADDLWHQDVGAIEGSAVSDARFGWALVAGKMDADEFEDLAISVIWSDSIAIIRGSSTGLVDTDDVLWNQDSTNIPDTVQAGDGFGHCLTYGREWNTNFNRGLGVCVPFKDHSSATDAGMLTVLYLNGHFSPAVSASSVSWIQSGFGDLNEAGEEFASSTLAPRDRPFANGVCD